MGGGKTKATTRTPVPDGVQVTVDRAALLSALAVVKTALPVRSATPVLSGVVLDAADGVLTVSGFDTDLSARIRLDAAVASTGRTLLPGRMLYEVVKNSSGRDVAIRTEDGKAVVSPGTAVFTLKTLPVERYPTLPAMPAAGGSVYVQQFFAAVKKVLKATGRSDSMPALAGIRVEFDRGKMILVSTDRFRLAAAELTWFPDGEADHGRPMLIPGKVLKLITARWGKATGRLRIGYGPDGDGDGDGVREDRGDRPDHLAGGRADGLADDRYGDRPDDQAAGVVGFSLGDETYTCRLLDGEFVDHRTLFAPDYPIGAVVETKPLIAAAKLVALVAEGTSPIRLSFAPGRVAVEAGDEARGSETVPCIWQGDPFHISLNPLFLLDGLSVLGQDFVRIGIDAPSKPFVLTAHHDPCADLFDGFRYLMVPLRTA